MAATLITIVTTLIPLWLALGDGILKEELYLPRPCLREIMAFTVYMFLLSFTPVNNSLLTQLHELLKEYNALHWSSIGCSLNIFSDLFRNEMRTKLW